jgi:hypothetical protein
MRAATGLVLMHAGRIATPEMAEEALREGWLDVACMTKAHIADAHFARKVFEGRTEDIRFCTRSLQACHGKMDRMTCIYNPVKSREASWSPWGVWWCAGRPRLPPKATSSSLSRTREGWST